MGVYMNLKELRLNSGLTVEEVAKKLGVVKQVVYDYDHMYTDRSVNFIIIAKLASIYNTSYTTVILACNNIDNADNIEYKGYNFDLKMLREMAGLNISKASRLLNIHRSTLHRYEQGLVPMGSTTIYAMSKVYNISCDDIMDACFNTYNKRG